MDYGSNGFYFITICTAGRRHYFGEIQNNEMMCSEIGIMARKYWDEIPEHFPFVKLHNHVVMPNHIHGVIQIAKSVLNVETQNFASLPQRANPPMSCTNQFTNPHHRHTKNQFGPQSKNLASIIRGYKIGVTKNARNVNPDFKWQARYHDHVIRNEEEFHKIQNYITNNPVNWKEDRFHTTK